MQSTPTGDFAHRAKEEDTDSYRVARKSNTLLTYLFRLKELKAESRSRREQREMEATALVAETKRRRSIVERQYYEWNGGARVDVSLIHTALRTYAELFDGSLLFSRPLDDVDKELGGFFLADYMAVCLAPFCFNALTPVTFIFVEYFIYIN